MEKFSMKGFLIGLILAAVMIGLIFLDREIDGGLWQLLL